MTVGRPHKHTRVLFEQQLHIFWIEITYFVENLCSVTPHATKEKCAQMEFKKTKIRASLASFRILSPSSLVPLGD